MWVFLGGSLAGVVLGSLASVAVLRWLRGAREKRALQALIMQVHLKRVFAENGPGALEPEFDRARCRSAVADIRAQVRDTLREVRPGSSSPQSTLLEMHRACEAYLYETERGGRNYEACLQELRLILHQGARRLSGVRHVQYLAPGQRSAVRREMLLAGARARTATRHRAPAVGARHGASRVGAQPVPAGPGHAVRARQPVEHPSGQPLRNR
ncbi:hypothetical protein ABIB35_001803 [Arthrobacter sp. UYP6]|uniref:hypothetical protein n=1 Tax=Arthrobacter sp. UYP6 TaxID=1756378 RepID=UPI003392999C